MEDVKVKSEHRGINKRKAAEPVVNIKTEGAKKGASSKKGKATAKVVPAKVKVRITAILFECAF
jgi:hypothetical protein